jgi:dATP pyrophosphohydrolase
MDIRQEIPIKSFAIAAYICKMVDGVCKHLIIRRSSGQLGGTWQMVSGRIEHGEKGWEAALREVKEETGLVPDRFYSANTIEAFYEVNQNCINLIPVFVGFIDTKQEVRLSHEHSEYRWITADKADDFLPSNNKRKCSRRLNCCLLSVSRIRRWKSSLSKRLLIKGLS